MKKLYCILTAAIVLFAGCEDEKEQISTSYLNLSDVEYASGPEGGKFDVTVKSDDIWEVSGRCEWARPLSDSGNSGDILTFEVDPNPLREIRTARFKVFSGSAVQVFTITSNPGFMMNLQSEPKVNLSSDAAQINIELDTNVPDIISEFTGSGADWIKYESRQEVFGKTILRYNISANEKYVDRETELTLSGNDKSAVVTISQAQLDAILTDTPKVVHTGLDANEVTFGIRANVDFTFALPNWLTLVSQTEGEKDAEGLTAHTITLSFGKSVSSRVADLDFVHKGNVLLQVSVKQQNPDAVLFNISDKVLRQELVKKGWILASDSSTECELLEPGMTGRALSLSNTGYYPLDIKTIDGLGNFPELETLSLNNLNVATIDLSDCKKISSMSAQKLSKLSEVNLGANPVTVFSTYMSGTYSSDYLESSSLTISSENLSEINVSSDSYYISYYEECKTIDVSGCPKLAVLKAKRETTDWYGDVKCVLEKLYVSQNQMNAIDSGILSVDKSEKTALEVR